MHKSLVTSLKRVALALSMAAVCSHPTCAKAVAGPEAFSSPDQAVAALVAANRANNSVELLKIFGPDGRDLISSGDRIADKDARMRFVRRYDKNASILRDRADKATLVVGTEEWPFPIPIVRRSGAWYFDAKAGAEEILDRRIGRNELSAIEICRHYVQAQRDFAADLAAELKPKEYAQKFVSSPGLHDGLYWPVKAGEPESPIGPQMAHARAEGYAGDEAAANEQRTPYYGYYYRILTRQGTAAPGGARDYVVGGRMINGFALIAFPANYGNSGVMTFVVNQAGIVFEKDLGPDTTSVATAITEFDPDRTWKTRL